MFDPYSNINFQQLLIAFRPQAFTLRVISVYITINYILVHNKVFLIEMTFIFMLAFASCIKCAGNRQRYLMLYDVECFKWIFLMKFQTNIQSLIYDMATYAVYFNYSCYNESYDEIFSYRFSSKVVNPTVQVCSCSKLGRHIAYR